MERITYRITLDAYKNGIQRTLQGFETGDNVSRRLAINLVSGGDTFEIAQDVIAMIYVHNGSVPSINACEIVDNTIIYDVLPIKEEGIFEMQVKLIEVGINGAQKVLVAPKFAVEVTESGTGDGGATGTTTFTALENALAQAKSVYDSRILSVEITSDCTFKVHYADGTVYENDYLNAALYNGNALLSESFAHGNTGVREGENIDNAKYYSLVSRSYSTSSRFASEEASKLLEEAKLHTTFTDFQVNFDTGNLAYMSANYKFDVNEETGDLEVDDSRGYDPNKVIKDSLEDTMDEFLDERLGAAREGQIPVSANNGVMQAIWEVVKSYLHQNDNLVYAHAIGSEYEEQGPNAMDYETGPEKLEITRNGVKKKGWCINCSTFVHLVLLGVPFEKSMYNPAYNTDTYKHNCINSAGYSFNMWGEDVTVDNYTAHKYTWDMANRFKELGLGFYPNANYSNLAAGDVVFFKRMQPLTNRVGEFEQNIYHVGIVLSKHMGEYVDGDYKTVLYTFAEVMSNGDSLVTVRTIGMDSNQLKNRRVYYVGRPIYSTVADAKKCIGYKKGAADGTTTFYVDNLDLRGQDVITLIFDYKPTSTSEYIQVYCNGVAIKRYTLGVTNGKITELDVGKTRRMVLPIRLSTYTESSVLGDDDTTKITRISVSAIASGSVVNSISNLSVWEGVNGDYINDYIVIEGTTTVEE